MGATAQKKIQTPMVPIKAPISGRRRSRWIGPRKAKRSSIGAARSGPGDGGVLTSVAVATVSSACQADRGLTSPRSAFRVAGVRSARPLVDELRDRVDVVRVDETGASEDR